MAITAISASEIRTAAQALSEQMTADRRHMHMYPELGFQEHGTSKYIADRLQQIGISFTPGIATTGLLGTIVGTAGSGKTVLLRADIDALPIEEQSEAIYKSRNPGLMHACGHDAHTSILLGAATVLQARRHEFAGTIKLAFQPAEECPPGGAIKMIEEGVMDNPKVDAAFGLHVTPQLETGYLGFRAGPCTAASDRFQIVIKGKGGHAARPNTTIDAVVIGAHVVVALQTLVSRETSPTQPAVVTVGVLRAGDASNVIPGEATLMGTVRSYDPDLRQYMARRLPELAKGIAKAMRADAEVTYTFGYPSLINDEKMTELARQVGRDLVGADHVTEVEPVLGGEDMSYFLQKAPGCFFRLGTGNRARGITFGNHHPKFDVDEAALPIGAAAMAGMALRFLRS